MATISSSCLRSRATCGDSRPARRRTSLVETRGQRRALPRRCARSPRCARASNSRAQLAVGQAFDQLRLADQRLAAAFDDLLGEPGEVLARLGVAGQRVDRVLHRHRAQRLQPPPHLDPRIGGLGRQLMNQQQPLGRSVTAVDMVHLYHTIILFATHVSFSLASFNERICAVKQLYHRRSRCPLSPADLLQAAAAQGPLGPPDRQPLREQLRRRGAPAERHPRRARRSSIRRRPRAFALNGLKREELIATNSMLLHEVYFDGLGGRRRRSRRRARRGDRARLRLDRAAGAPSSSPWARRWAAARAGCCSRARRATARSATSGRPITRTRLAGGTPILALDMYEHSYHIDFGANAAAMSMPSWPTSPGQRIAARFAGAARAQAAHRSTRRRRAQLLESDPDLLVIDARLADDATPCRSRLRGARRAPPDKVDAVAAVAAQGHQGAGLLRLGLRDRRRLRRQAARARHRCRGGRRRHRRLARRRPAHRTTQGRRQA